MPTPVLTAARRSLWDAILNWPTLQGRIATAIAYDREIDAADFQFLEYHEPGQADLTCLAIEYLTTTPTWWTNQQQLWPVQFQVKLWTPDWDYAEPEELIEQIILAVHQSSPVGSNVTFIRSVAGQKLPANGGFTSQFGWLRDGENESEATKITLTTMPVIISLAKNPFA